MFWKIVVLLVILTSMNTAICTEATDREEESATSWLMNALCYGGISDEVNQLIGDLYTDTTNEREYIAGVYDCTNYAINLTANLTDGYDAGIVAKLSKMKDAPGHMATWVRSDGLLYVIEPQNDMIYGAELFNETIDAARFMIIYGSEELGLTEYNTTTSSMVVCV